MSSELSHFTSEEIEHLSNGFGRMRCDYGSSRGPNHNGFTYNSAHVEVTPNGWDDDSDELKEEDLWGGQGTTTSWDHSYHEQDEASFAYQSATENGTSAKGIKGRKSWLSMELQAVGLKKEHVGVGFAALEAVHNGVYGSGKESNGGWAPGFLTRKVKIPQHTGGGVGGSGYTNGWQEHNIGSKRGGVMQSAPVSMPAWPSKYEYGESNGGAVADDRASKDDGDHEDYDDDDDDDNDNDNDNDDDDDDEGDGDRGRGGRLAPHEIVDRECARSQSTTFSVIEGAGRTLKGMDLRRVRNAVWSRIGFED